MIIEGSQINPDEVLTTLAALNLQILLFAKKLEDADTGIDKGVLDRLKKVLRNND